MKKQLIILWIGIGLLVFAILFPPWMVNSGGTRKFLGYGFLFSSSRELASFSSIESSRLIAEILIIILLTAGVFYTAKIFPSSITLSQKMRRGLKLVIAVVVAAGVVTFIGVLLEIHLQAKKAQPIPAPKANAQQAIGNQPTIILPGFLKAVEQGNLAAIRVRPTIHIAADRGNLAVVKQCLQEGADINARVENSKTPLMFAAAKGNMDIVKVLVAKGADVNARDENGWTALMYIIGSSPVRLEVMEVVKCLLTKGADVNARDKNGQTALMLAEHWHERDVIEFLKQHGAVK